MEFRTKIDIPKSEIQISHQNRLLMLGSCFAESMGDLLQANKFAINVNPFGILYNPMSISQALKKIISGREFTEKDLFQHNHLYHSPHHHGRFSDADKDKCLAKINKELKQTHNDLCYTDILFVTLGTSYVFHSQKEDIIVGNCHKLPASEFHRYRLNTDTIVGEWNNLLTQLTSVNKNMLTIFTISPIRHAKDGMHENQVSKATLLLAVDELCRTNKRCFYFPSYEIVLDELRDYRFYNEDMIHPNASAVKYIWERFSETYFSNNTLQIVNEWQKIQSAIQHRPLNKKTENYKHFLKQTLLRLKDFGQKYSYICLEKEITDLTDKIGDSDNEIFNQ